MSLIRVEQVSKMFKENVSQPIYALSSISIQIQEGEFTALSGPSGSGKTTLLNLIGCLDKPSEGKIYLDNEEISRLKQSQLSDLRLRKIGFIFQDYNLIPAFTAIENVEYALWLQGVSAIERRKRSVEVCKRFGIEHLLNRRPYQMSRGQQQRIAVARAIVHKPRIVLGDELTANLDHKTGTELMIFLKELNQTENITFVYATHDPAVLKQANRVIKLQDGKHIGEEKPAHVTA